MKTVLHVAPHPDDEVLGAGVALLRLRDAGCRIVNLTVSLGRPADHERRRAEAVAAAARSGFELLLPDPPIAISADDDLARAQRDLSAVIEEVVREERVDLVVSPSPHDGHHGHELVGRSVAVALDVDTAPEWWMWGLWADLPVPTILIPFDEDWLAEALVVLWCHSGELARNDYDRLLAARAAANAVLGSERVFGFGTARAHDAPYAELISAVHHVNGRWVFGSPRVLDPTAVLGRPGATSADAWLRSPSARYLATKA